MTSPNCQVLQPTAATTQTPLTKKRPTGLTVIAIIWGLTGLYNIATSLNTIGTDLSVLPDLSNPSLDPWFQFGVPAETALSVFLILFGLLQFVTVYGLWRGKSWSYRSALAIPILIVLINASFVVLYYSAPLSLNLRSPTLAGSVAGGVVWVVVYWGYLRRGHVKEYLNVIRHITKTDARTDEPTN